MKELFVTIEHDFHIFRMQTFVEYLTVKNGEPILIGEFRDLNFSYELATDKELFDFWAEYKIPDEYLKCVRLSLSKTEGK